MNQEDEVIINLADLFAYILHHWKLILLWMVICGVLVGGLMSYRDYKGIKNKYEDTTYTAMVADLTDSQIETVNLYYNRYLSYKDRITDSQYYIDNSLKMALDANNISVLTKEYLIETSNYGLINSFSVAAIDYDDYQKMAEIYGGDVDARYLYELVSLSATANQDAYAIDTDKVGDVINGSIGNTYAGILTISITAGSKEECERLMEVASTAVDEHLRTLQGSDVDIQLSELTLVYTEKVDTSLAEYQRSKTEEGSTLVTDYQKFESTALSSMDEGEQAVFNYLIEKDEAVTDHVSWKKWIAIGLALGMVLSGIYIVIRYLLIPGLKTNDDAYRLTKEKEMAVIIQPSTSKVLFGKFIHGWARGIELHGLNQVKDEEAISILCDRIRQICKTEDKKTVILLSDVTGGYTGEVVDKCLTLLHDAGLEAVAGDPSASMDALRNLRDSDVAFLVLTTKSSLPDSVMNNIRICEENKVPVMGNFIVHGQI